MKNDCDLKFIAINDYKVVLQSNRLEGISIYFNKYYLTLLPIAIT
jgi:hypothetical protein